MQMRFDWGDLYPELVNKVRWAICSTFKSPDYDFPYSEGQKMATVLAQDVIDLLKACQAEPGVMETTGSMRGFFAQKQVAEHLDKLDGQV